MEVDNIDEEDQDESKFDWKMRVEVDDNQNLNETQIEKLRHLTLISLGSQSRNLSYDLLMKQFGLDGGEEVSDLMPSTSQQSTVRKIQIQAMRKLEDIIIDAIYAGIITARLDQTRQRVEVESVLGRDVRGEEGIQMLSNALHDWQDQTVKILQKQN